MTPPEILHTVSGLILSKKSNRPLLVAVNGKDASGKTIFAQNLTTYLSKRTKRIVVNVSLDGFLNPSAIRNATFESEARGSYESAFNTKGFIDNFLEPLTGVSRVYRPAIYDLSTDHEVISEFINADDESIFIVDGLFLFRNALREYWDVKILLEADEATLVERGARRDASVFGSYEAAKKRYLSRYMPSQTIYYEEAKPGEVADIIIDNAQPEQALLVRVH